MLFFINCITNSQTMLKNFTSPFVIMDIFIMELFFLPIHNVLDVLVKVASQFSSEDACIRIGVYLRFLFHSKLLARLHQK